MKIQVLLSTMNQKSVSLYKKNNIQTDAIIINQTNLNSYENCIDFEKKIEMFSFAEKGIGKSRNSALLRSDADICILADDDMIFEDNYEKEVFNAFKKNPQADIIIFNVVTEDENGKISYKVNKNQRINNYNYLKYGAANIAFRRKKIVENHIFFSLLFGGGATYGSGEDTLFLTHCLRAGLKIYTCEIVTAKIFYRPSTWFYGYDAKFFYDKGALFTAIGNKTSYIKIIYFIIRHRKKFNGWKWSKLFYEMYRGSKGYKNSLSYEDYHSF